MSLQINIINVAIEKFYTNPNYALGHTQRLFHGQNTDLINNRKLIVRRQQFKFSINFIVDQHLHYSKSSAFEDAEMDQNSVVERKYILPCSYGEFYVQIEHLKIASVHSSRKAGNIYVLTCQKQISTRVIMFANGKITW